MLKFYISIGRTQKLCRSVPSDMGEIRVKLAVEQQQFLSAPGKLTPGVGGNILEGK